MAHAWEDRVKDLFNEYNNGYATIDIIKEEIETELIDEIPIEDMENILSEISEIEEKEVELLSFENLNTLDEETDMLDNFAFDNNDLW